MSRRTVGALPPCWREGFLYGQMLLDIARGGDPAALESKYPARGPIAAAIE